MVKISDVAVKRAMQMTGDTQQSMARNLNAMGASVQHNLAAWNDTNVLQFLNVYREHVAAMNALSRNLEQIHAFCNNTLRWMNAYLS